MRRALASVGILSCLILGAPSAGAQSTAPFQYRVGHIGGIVPSRSLGITAPAIATPLQYHGGPTMRTNTVYAIYWVPSGYSVDANYQSDINSYFSNVAADNGKLTNVYSIATQYGDSTGSIAYNSSFGGAAVVTDSLPHNGCSDSYTKVCLTDLQIQNEISQVISTQGWRPGPTTEFFMFTAKGIGSCFDTTSSTCAFSQYCAYHGFFGNTIYSNMPYADTVPPNCDSGRHPNNDDADATINVTSHEAIESITDPMLNAWYDGSGAEIGDKCAWSFGDQLGGSLGSAYNEVIGSGKYWLQQEWSNLIMSCPQTAPTIAVTPASGARGSSLHVTGEGFSYNASVILKFACTATACGSTALSMGTITADRYGNFFAVAKTVPTRAKIGAFLIGAKDKLTGAYSTAAYQVTS